MDDLEPARPRRYMPLLAGLLAAIAVLSLVELGVARIPGDPAIPSTSTQAAPGVANDRDPAMNCRSALPLLMGVTDINRGVFASGDAYSGIRRACHSNAVPVYVGASVAFVLGAVVALRGTASARAAVVVAGLVAAYGVGRIVGTGARIYEPLHGIQSNPYIGPSDRQVAASLTAGLDRRDRMTFGEFAIQRYTRQHPGDCGELATTTPRLAVRGGNDHGHWGDVDIYLSGCMGPGGLIHIATFSLARGAADLPICGDAAPGAAFEPEYCMGAGSDWLADFFAGDAP